MVNLEIQNLRHVRTVYEDLCYGVCKIFSSVCIQISLYVAMSFVYAHPGHSMLWVFLTLNTLISANVISKPGVIAYQPAKTRNLTVHSHKIDPR